MKKSELSNAVSSFNEKMKDGLTLMYNELNQGQQKKICKNEQVKALLERYGVIE